MKDALKFGKQIWCIKWGCASRDDWRYQSMTNDLCNEKTSLSNALETTLPLCFMPLSHSLDELSSNRAERFTWRPFTRLTCLISSTTYRVSGPIPCTVLDQKIEIVWTGQRPVCSTGNWDLDLPTKLYTGYLFSITLPLGFYTSGKKYQLLNARL